MPAMKTFTSSKKKKKHNTAPYASLQQQCGQILAKLGMPVGTNHIEYNILYGGWKSVKWDLQIRKDNNYPQGKVGSNNNILDALPTYTMPLFPKKGGGKDNLWTKEQFFVARKQWEKAS